ncbi:hypothetical protein KP509_17G034500 [Ceratopteris richardii]|uniref:Uncharacterized protein n=1 Tax=Ceratopteris richardii TaxID=49495 RepID=A0A8T2SXD1_CERRI|nr:hypothetical protein KP509_17G034500 [Ceratopteris richardii]
MLALFTSAFHGAFFPTGGEGILQFCDNASLYIPCPPQIAPARVHHAAASVNDGVDEPSNAAENLAPMDQLTTVPRVNEDTINVPMDVQCCQLPAQSTEASPVATTPLILGAQLAHKTGMLARKTAQKRSFSDVQNAESVCSMLAEKDSIALLQPEKHDTSRNGMRTQQEMQKQQCSHHIADQLADQSAETTTFNHADQIADDISVQKSKATCVLKLKKDTSVADLRLNGDTFKMNAEEICAARHSAIRKESLQIDAPSFVKARHQSNGLFEPTLPSCEVFDPGKVLIYIDDVIIVWQGGGKCADFRQLKNISEV